MHFVEQAHRGRRHRRLPRDRRPDDSRRHPRGHARRDGRRSRTDPWGNERAGFSAKGKISRGDFGLTWNQVLEAGGVAVGDEVKLSIDVELVQQTAQTTCGSVGRSRGRRETSAPPARRAFSLSGRTASLAQAISLRRAGSAARRECRRTEFPARRARGPPCRPRPNHLAGDLDSPPPAKQQDAAERRAERRNAAVLDLRTGGRAPSSRSPAYDEAPDLERGTLGQRIDDSVERAAGGRWHRLGGALRHIV